MQPETAAPERPPSSLSKLLAGRFQSDLLNLAGVLIEVFAVISVMHSGAAFTFWIIGMPWFLLAAAFALWLALRRARRAGGGLSPRALWLLFALEVGVIALSFVGWIWLQGTGSVAQSWAVPGFGLGFLLVLQALLIGAAGFSEAGGATRPEIYRSVGRFVLAAGIAVSVGWGAWTTATTAQATGILWPSAVGALAWLLLEALGIHDTLAGRNKPRIRGDGVRIGPPSRAVTALSVVKSGLQIVGMGFLAAHAFGGASDLWLLITAVAVTAAGSAIGMIGGVIRYRQKYPKVAAEGDADDDDAPASTESLPSSRSFSSAGSLASTESLSTAGSAASAGSLASAGAVRSAGFASARASSDGEDESARPPSPRARRGQRRRSARK